MIGGRIGYSAVRFTALASLLVVGKDAFAHAVGAEVNVRGPSVVVEAFFDDDTPAVDARIKVVGDAGKLVAEGRTDKKGHWMFPTPAPGRYRVSVDAGAGHLAQLTVTIASRQSAKATEPPATAALPKIASSQTAPPVQLVSDGVTRAEFTATPWLRVGVGLAVIACLTLGIIGFVRIRRLAQRPPKDFRPAPPLTRGA